MKSIVEIFKYVDQPDLLQLQLTSKSWGEVAQDILYTNIGFGDSSVYTDSKLVKFIGTITTSPIKEELCKLVREIDFTQLSSYTLPEASLRIFGKLYSNIQTVNADHLEATIYESLLKEMKIEALQIEALQI
jgi:hypothetical protein